MTESPLESEVQNYTLHGHTWEYFCSRSNDPMDVLAAMAKWIGERTDGETIWEARLKLEYNLEIEDWVYVGTIEWN